MAESSTAAPIDPREARRTLWLAFRRIFPYLRPHFGWMAVAILMAILNSIVTIAIMYTVMAGFGHIVVGNLDAIRSTAFNLIVLAVVENLIRIIYNSVIIRVNERLAVTIRNELIARLHNAQLSRHVSQASGEWVTKVLFEADRFRGFLTNSVMEVVNSVVWFAAFSVFLLALSPGIALPTLVVIPLMTYVALRWTRRLERDTRDQRHGWDEMVGFLNQHIDGLADTRAFGQERAVLNDLRDRSNEYTTIHNRLSRKRLWLSSYLGFTVHIALALLVFFGGLQILSGQQLGSGFLFNMATGLMPMTWMLLGTDSMMASMGMAQGAALAAGTLAAFSLFAKRMLNPVRDLAHQFGEVSDVALSARRILDVLDLPEEGDTGQTLPPVRGHLQVDHVSFSYTDDVEVLHEVTLEVGPGGHIGIIGTSGAGKSTLMQLLVRLYTPGSGTVRIDGYDLSSMSRTSVRTQALLVSQEAQLFDGTVSENIRFGQPEASDGDVVAAAEAIGADEVISKLGDGYQTRVGERGSRLSVGERQLVALTRAMLADPRLVILDEAFSSVDPVRQRTVLAAIRRLLEGRTAVVVAHWLELIEDVDRVFILEEGRVVESGPPVELMMAGGRLAELCDVQTGNDGGKSTERSTAHV